MTTNILSDPEILLANIIQTLGQPIRLKILFAMARQEVCVCHFEAVLGIRQASISQHLINLKRLGWVVTRRDGRFIYYKLARPEVIDNLRQLALTAGIPLDFLEDLSTIPAANCPCPQCNSDLERSGLCSPQG